MRQQNGATALHKSPNPIENSTMPDPARLNQANIRLVQRRPTLNDILPKLNNAKYLSLKDASSGHHNLKLDEKSSYLTTFACQFGTYSYKRLPFGAAPTGDVVQRKLEKYLKIYQMYLALQMIF